MSDKVGSSSSSGCDEDRKGKRIKYSDDDTKESEDSFSFPPPVSSGDSFSFPPVPSGLNAEDLSVFHMISERDGAMGLPDFMRQQQQALQNLELIKNPLQISDIWSNYTKPLVLSSSRSSQKENVPDQNNVNNFEDYDDSFGSDLEDENDGPDDGLIFELEISENERLVIPSMMVYGEFPVMMYRPPDHREIFQLTDYLGREWEVTVNYSKDLHAYIFTTGWSLYLQHHGLKPPDLVRFYNPAYKLHLNHFCIQHEKSSGDNSRKLVMKPITVIPAIVPPTAERGNLMVYLFKMQIPRSNRLRIYFDRAVGHFKPPQALPPPNHLREFNIYLTDYLEQTWEMRFLRFDDEEAFIFVRGWEQYKAKHGLRHKDIIKFYKKDILATGNRFLIFHEKPSQESDSQLNEDEKCPEFLPENILYEVSLSKADVEFGKLEMPGVQIPFLCRGKEMVKLSDQNNKNWYMIIMLVEKGYMLIDGWEGYVNEFKLEAGDMVGIYLPACSDHDKHFLIQCEKKRKNKKTEKQKGGSGLGKPDDRAALRQCVKPITTIPTMVPPIAKRRNLMVYLFKVLIPRSNRLRIYFDRAVGHFNPPQALPPPDHLRKFNIYLTDYLEQTWEMKFLRFDDEEAYIFVRGWEQYAAKHDLRHRDIIKFCKKDKLTARNRFLIFHEKPNQESDSRLNEDEECPEFLPENILYKVSLSKADVEFGRLEMPGVEIPFLCRGKEMVKLSDQNNKNWYMIIMLVKKGYMLIDGWEGYVNEFKLEAGDMVGIYLPACSDHDKHLLIQCEKKRKNKKTEKEKGESGLGKPDDRAAHRQGISRKGKEKL